MLRALACVSGSTLISLTRARDIGFRRRAILICMDGTMTLMDNSLLGRPIPQR